MSDCRNPHLSAYDRASIEDAERSTKAAQTAQGCADDEIVYGFQFCDVPSSTMLGETMFDYNGEPVGWIVSNGVKGDCGHDADMSDSREKLEAEIRYEYNGRIEWEADQIIEWLDRQAAITTQECTDVYETGCEACRSAQKRKIAELQERVDNLCASEEIGNKLIMAQLETDAEQNRTIVEYAERVDMLEAALKGERNNFYQAMESRKHWQRKYETVKAERDELKSKADALEADKASWQSGYHIDRLAKLQAQRDRYRELLSKAVDEAQVIVKLMEVES